MFHAYVVVVINGHESIYCFGNASADIITLYQRDDEGIHFDAFVEVPTAIPESDVADGGEAGDEDGIQLAASAPLPPTVSQGMVVYGGV
jgi:hypothetical protein